MKNNVDKHNNFSIIITTFIIILTISMGIIYGPEKEKIIKEKDTSVAANTTGNERKDIGTIGQAEFDAKYKEDPYAEYITKYNKWLWDYSGSTAGKAIGAGKWRVVSIKRAAWCYIFVDWCAKEAGCKLVVNDPQKSTSEKGFPIETAIADATDSKGWFKKNDRFVAISSRNALVSEGEVGDMVYSVGTGQWAGQNHVCFIGSKTSTSVTLQEGDYIDSDGKFKVWERNVTASTSAIFSGVMKVTGLGKPMYRATATFKTNGGTIKSMPDNWFKVSESGSGSTKEYKYKFFDDLELYDGNKKTYLPDKDDMSRSGYTFNGWKDKDGYDVTKIKSKQRGNITFYAQWKSNDYTIEYEPNGGTIHGTYPKKYTPGVGATLPTNVTYDGYDFAGWFGKSDFSGGVVKTIGTTATGNKKYYAKWTPKSYTIAYETNNGTIKSGKVTSYTYGQGATLPTDVVRNGCTFAGWYMKSDFSDNKVTTISKTDMGDKTFYAKWTPNVYTITYDTKGGTINSGKVDRYTYGQGATLPTDVTKKGHTFGGWYGDDSFSKGPYGSIGTSATGNKTYYAKWVPKVYGIEYDTKGGTINSGKVTSYTYGVGATLPTNVTRTGYDFKGWFTDSGLLNGPITSIGKTEEGAKKYYAKWTPKVYTVTLHPNGGTFAPGTEVKQYTYTYGAKLPNALQITKPGCEFVGWYEKSDFSGSVVTKILPTDLGNKEYWAKWNTFDLSSEKALYYVYGLNNDNSVYRAEKITLNIKTQSTSKMYAVLATNTDYAYKLTTPLSILPNKDLILNVPKSIAASVAKNKKDRVIYAIVEVNCSQYDGDRYVDYKLYFNRKITLRYSTSYNLW